MSNKEKSKTTADITPENLEKAIDKYQRQDVMRMLKGGVLSGLDDEKKQRCTTDWPDFAAWKSWMS
ncbi:MAG: hypothetical protein LIO96_02600 [Lachnospiraceae bacterium]|nr:hypothetical protein [Lachnospiraceae bacterium]